MILNCRVVSIDHGTEFTDEKERIWVRIKEADPTCCHIRLVNTTGLKLGQEFQLSPYATPAERGSR